MSYKYKVGEEYKSRNQDQIDTLTEQYTNRGQFSYDPEADSAYQTYVKLMKENGQKAMEDTMGKAASMTGGYGNSYASTVGQQVYNDYMREASAAQSDFEDRARDRYNAESDDLLSRLSILQNQENTDRANWESDYAHTWSDAQMKAEYGDVSRLAALLGMDETELKVALGHGEVPSEMLTEFQAAIKNGKGQEYLNTLSGDGYNPSDLIGMVNRWSATGALGGTAELIENEDGSGYSLSFTPDEDSIPVYGMGSIIPESFKLMSNNPKEGEVFEIIRTKDGTGFHDKKYGSSGNNWDLKLDTEITDAKLLDRLSDQKDGFVYYNGEAYYVSGDKVFGVAGIDKNNLEAYLRDYYA